MRTDWVRDETDDNRCSREERRKRMRRLWFFLTGFQYVYTAQILPRRQTLLPRVAAVRDAEKTPTTDR
jgi:hypothetical protein